jgi:hypothetical protein
MTNIVRGSALAHELKTYEVEFKKTSWMIVTVEAESQSVAEDKAFQHLEDEGILKDAVWEIASVGELGGTK